MLNESGYGTTQNALTIEKKKENTLTQRKALRLEHFLFSKANKIFSLGCFSLVLELFYESSAPIR